MSFCGYFITDLFKWKGDFPLPISHSPFLAVLRTGEDQVLMA